MGFNQGTRAPEYEAICGKAGLSAKETQFRVSNSIVPSLSHWDHSCFVTKSHCADTISFATFKAQVSPQNSGTHS